MRSNDEDEDDAFGETEGRVVRAGRAAVMVDTASYFRAFVEAASLAEHSITIIAWDVDSRTELTPDGDSLELRDFLFSLARDRPELQIRVLCWDAAIIYKIEREAWKRVKFGWRRPPNVRFEFDSGRRTGVSLHQKLVVIDDQVAFSGGVDLTRERWDTVEHHIDDDRRVAPDGDRYGPFHDVQVAVDGPCARLLGEIARSRWESATDESLDAAPVAESVDHWPASLSPDFEDVDVRVSQTLSADDDDDPCACREIESQYVRMIEAARRRIYIETQYLTSELICEKLEERLAEPAAPEVVIVTPRQTPGTTEQATIGVLRWRCVDTLRDADTHGRLRIVHPRVEEDGKCADVYVHSKVCIVDGAYVHVGSANLTTRSLRLDFECDLTFLADADGARACEVDRVLANLLGVHLGRSATEIAAELEERSLCELLDASSGTGHSLVSLNSDEASDGNGFEAYADLQHSLEPAVVARELLSEEDRASRPFLKAGIFLVLMIGIAALWRFTPANDLLDPEILVSWFEPIRETGWGPVLALLVVTVLALVGVPIVVLILACGVTMGTLMGGAVALTSVCASATTAFMVGRRIGRDAVERLTFSFDVESLHQKIADRGIVAIVALRIIPVAPFFVVNLVAGASRITLRDYMFATVAAMAPGTVVLVYYGSQLLEFLRGANFAALVGVVVVVIGVATIAWWAEKKLDAPRHPKQRTG